MKWVGGDSQDTPASSSGMLGNGSHAPLQTVSLLVTDIHFVLLTEVITCMLIFCQGA